MGTCKHPALAWCAHCDSWERKGDAYGENSLRTGQVVTLPSLLGRPWRLRSTQKQVAASCVRCAGCITCVTSPAAASRDGDEGEPQQVLWRSLFQDSIRWWDKRHRTKNPLPSDVQHKESGEALWLDHCYNACVDAQLTVLDARTDCIAPASSLSDRAGQLVGPGSGSSSTPEDVKKLCQQGQVKRAVEVLEVLVETNSGIDNYLLYSALKECMAKKDLLLGGKVHALSVKMGFGSDTFLCNHFIRMYAAHGKLQEAMDVFRGVVLPDAFTWSAIISAHTKQGQAERAIELYHHMRGTRTAPDNYVFVAALQACATAGDLQSGKQLHSQIKERGLESDMVVGGSLVNMYAKCGSLPDARTVFGGLRHKNVVTWNAMIAGYAKVEGMGQEALTLYSVMHNEGLTIPDAVTFVCLLQACANVGVSALGKGKQLHSQIKERGLESDLVVGGSLVNMYAKCGCLLDARTVFDGLREKNVVAWNAMIAGYAKVGAMGEDAHSLYSAMHSEGMATPDAVTFVCLLQACANVGVSALGKGKQLHLQIKERGLDSDMVVGGSLVNMYAKCGSLRDARAVFDGLREKNVVTWSAMIAGYAKVEGMGQDALNLYSAMDSEGMVSPDCVTFVCLLQACANVGASALEKGRQLHYQIRQRGLESDIALGNSLVNMYAKCGSLTDARSVFDRLLERKDVVTWTVMIAGYSKVEGMGQDALSLYSAMHNEGISIADAVTFVCLLQACANVGVPALETGQLLHFQLKDQQLEFDVAIGASLVNMYAKCGSLTNARIIFDGLPEKNVVTWNAMISGYAQQDGMGQRALDLYSAMRDEGKVTPDAVTYLSLLQACANVGVSALEKGKQLHSQIKAQGLEPDMHVGGSLVNMYAKCGSLMDARFVFDRLGEKNVVIWTVLIAGYAKVEGMGLDALNLYSAMHNEGMAIPDAVTFVCLLQACANVGVSALEQGKQLHSQIKERRLESDMVVGGSLVNMYAKCESLENARIVFDSLREKNVVTWNAMISGYALQDGMGQRALEIYRAMQNEGLVTPDAVTYVCLLQACASVGALQQGKELHSKILEAGLESNVLIGTGLVQMYAKCGRKEVLREVFDRLTIKSPGTWSALIKAYAELGEGSLAIQCFEELLEQGIQPNEVIYICLLTACSHAGLVDDGQRYFASMEERHGVKPDEWHYTCMVDLLGRSGHLDRAVQMLQTSGLGGSVVSWTALLSACKCYGDADLGRRCFDRLVHLQPTVATAYVLLGSIYANAGRWDEVGRVEALRKAAGARKKAAKACIEVSKEVHEFTVGEARSDVASSLRKMNTKVKEGGHVPQTQLVLRAVCEQEKEDALCGHAEKLALAYGLLNTSAGSTLVVTKNLRMCNDCHSSTKVMSRVEKREIVVRDGHKVHRFQNGTCSCQDRP